MLYFFFFNDTATTEIYTLSLHDALPIWWPARRKRVHWIRDGRDRRRRNRVADGSGHRHGDPPPASPDRAQAEERGGNQAGRRADGAERCPGRREVRDRRGPRSLPAQSAAEDRDRFAVRGRAGPPSALRQPTGVWW